MVNNMKKNLKKDIFNILLLIVVFFVVYFCITKNEFLFGSTKDWNQQHYLIPEYFRNLFYKNFDLFPDFAFNLGSGQNIYNFSYYGFLSPVILVSYFLPFISMKSYIIGSTIFMLLLSVVLMYFFIKNKSNSKVAFISSFIFLLATPLIYHAHRHVMFMNYMPFLIMGYFGVDKYFKDRSSWLLTLSMFLMTMTSYFFSVGGLVSIILYGIYCYIKINKNTREVVVNGEKLMNLTPKEFDLLYYFVQNPRQVFSREQLLERVWSYQFYGDERTVDVHIKRLRKKIGSKSQPFFHTVWGVGYKFDETLVDQDEKEN